jgi:hypothetical protein
MEITLKSVGITFVRIYNNTIFIMPSEFGKSLRDWLARGEPWLIKSFKPLKERVNLLNADNEAKRDN